MEGEGDYLLILGNTLPCSGVSAHGRARVQSVQQRQNMQKSDFSRCIMGPARGDDLDGGVTSQRRRDPGHMWKKVEEGWTERLFWGFFYMHAWKGRCCTTRFSSCRVLH